MYWILMRNSIDNCVDGFGRYPENIDGDEFVEEDDYKHIKRILSRFICKVNIFDAKTVKIWG